MLARRTLPSRLEDARRTRWSLAELVKWWASQGAQAIDVLILAWETLERTDRPDGLTIVPERNSRVAFRDDPVSPEGLAAVLRMGLDRRNLAHRLYLTRELASWLLDKLTSDHEAQLPDTPEAPSSSAHTANLLPAVRLKRRPSKCFDAQDEPIIAEMHTIVVASKGQKTAAEAVRELAQRLTLAGSANSAERRIARKYRKRYLTHIEA